MTAAVVHPPGSYFADFPDGVGYLQLADSLAFRGEFARDGLPEIERTPGYPLFIALGARIGHPIGVTVALQAILGALSAVLVFKMTLRVTGSRLAASAAGLLFAVDPPSVIHGVNMFTETLFVFVLLVHLVILLRCIEQNRHPALAAAAGAAAAAAVFGPAQE